MRHFFLFHSGTYVCPVEAVLNTTYNVHFIDMHQNMQRVPIGNVKSKQHMRDCATCANHYGMQDKKVSNWLDYRSIWIFVVIATSR